MGDDDELGFAAEGPHIPGKANHVGLVQGRLDLVHDTEGGGMDLQDRKIQGDGHKGLLSAGEQGDGLEGLSRRLRLDLNAAVQDILRVLQLQRGGAAAEQLQERGLKGLADELELLPENPRHLLGDILDDPGQFSLGPLHIVPLIRQIGVPGVHPLEFVDGAHIDIAKAPDLPLQLSDAAVGLGDALQLDPLLHSRGMAELVVLPQPVQDLALLHGAGGLPLLQPGHLPLDVQQRVVALLQLPVRGGALLLNAQLLLPQLLQLLPAEPNLLPQPLRLRCALFQLRLDLLIGAAVLLQQCLPGGLVPHHILPKLLEIRQGPLHGIPLGAEGREIRFMGGDRLSQRGGELLQPRLPGEMLLRLAAVLLRLGVMPGDLLLLLRHSPPGILQSAGEGLLLSLQVLQAGAQGLQQHVVLSFLPLELQHRVLRCALLALGHLPLIAGGGELPLGLLRLLARLGQRLGQLFQLPPQGGQLIGPGQDPGAAADAAAGHGAAPVDDLSVQCNNAEPVLVLARHGDAAVQVLHHHGAAQKIAEDAFVLAVIAHQAGGHAYKAVFALQPPLPQLLTPDGGEGQEGGPSAVPLLQELNGALGVLLPVHHDVLHPGSQGDLNGHGVGILHLYQAGDGAMDAPQGVLLRSLHHQAHRLVEALVLLFHLRQEGNAVRHGLMVHGELHFPVLRRLMPLLPALQLHGVAGDHVADGGGLLLRILQAAAALLGLGLLPLQGLPGGGQLGRHLPLAILHLRDAGSKGRELRPGVRRRGHRQSLLSPQALRLLGGATVPLGGLLGPLEQCGELRLQLSHVRLDLLDAAALLLDLEPQALAAAVLVRQLPADALHALAVVLQAGIQHGGRAVLLADLPLQLGDFPARRLLVHIVLPGTLSELFVGRVQIVQRLLGLLLLFHGGGIICLQLPALGLQLLQIAQPHGDLQHPQLIA